MSPYLKISILPITAVFCILAIWFFIKPIYEKTRTLNNVNRPQLETLVQRETEMQQRSEKLYNSLNEGDEINSVMNAIPEEDDSNLLISQIEYIVNQEKMVLAAITIEPPASDQAAAASGIVSQSQTGAREINGSIDIRGSYSQLKQFITDFYKLNRLVNINKLEVSNANDDEGGTIGKFYINFTAYWQPKVAPDAVRSALDSMELNQASNPNQVPQTLNTVPSVPTNNL